MTTYRISAPDGKTYQIEGPEGATQDQVKAEVMRQNPQLSGATPTPAPSRGTALGGAPLQFDPIQTAMNFPGSVGHQLVEAASMVASPIQTGTGVMDLARGAYLSILPKGMQQHMLKTDPERTQRALATAQAAGNFYADRYGSAQGFLTALQNDPAGVALDVSSVFTGGGGLLKAGAAAGARGVTKGLLQGEGTLAAKAAEVATPVVGAVRTAGDVLSTAGAYTNPFAPVAKIVEKVGPVAGQVASSLAAVVLPEKLKYKGLAAALDNNPALMSEVMDLLKQGKTIQEAAAITGTPGLAAFTSTAINASTETQRMFNAIKETLRAQQANQLEGATNVSNRLIQQALPAATGRPSTPRTAVSGALASEEAALRAREATQTAALTAQAGAAAAKLAEQQTARTGALTAEQQAAEASLAQQRANLQAGLPEISPEVSGKALGEARAQGLKNVRTEVTGPAYQKAFELAPEPFSIQSVVDKAKALGQDLMSVLAPNTAPNELSSIQRAFQPATPPAPAAGMFGVKAPTVTPPAMATLSEAADLNHALSMAYGQVKNARMGEPARVLRDNIDAIRKELHDAIARGAPANAVEAYAAARKLHATEVVDPFYTGQLSKIGQTTRLNQPGLPHEQVVGAALSDIQEAQTFAKTFTRDPAAMEVLKNGILDQFRRDVSQVTAAGNEVSAKAAKEWLFKHKEVVDVYDKAGMGLGAEVERVAKQAYGLETAATGVKKATEAIPGKVKAEFTPATEALAAQETNIKPSVIAQFAEENKALQLASDTLNFKYVKDLRQKVVADPMTADMALRRMDAPAKSALARGVMQDAAALKDGAKILDHLTTNEAGIMRVLKASEPATAAKTFAAMKDAAETLRLVQETSSKLPTNAMAAAKNLGNLTQGMPEVRAVVANIQAQLAAGAKFDELVAQGGKAGTTAEKLFHAEISPRVLPLNKVMSIVNVLIGRLEGRIDKKLAVQIANELSTSSGAAEALAKAQATRANIGATSNKLGAALRSPVAPAAVSVTNALAP